MRLPAQYRLSSLRQLPEAFWVIAFTCVLSLTLLLFVDTYASNLIYHDQWDLYNPMFSESGIASAFLYQHGPHRQGLGGIATYILARETNFSVIAESYMIACVLIATVFLTLALKRKFEYKLVYGDIALSFIVLNPVQFETITSVPNVSHSILPLFLLILVARIWISNNNWVQYLVSSIIAGLALFTGFGIFVWAAVFGLVAWNALQAIIAKNHSVTYSSLLGTGIMLLFAGWFMKGYQLHPTENVTSTIHQPISDYLVFTNYLFGRIFYLPKAIRPYTGFLTLIPVCLLAFHVLKVRMGKPKESKLYDICILFFATSFFYIAVTAIGRIDFGVGGGGSSRYMSLTLPCFIAIYLILVEWQQRKNKQTKGLYLAFILLSFLSYFSNSFYAHDMSIDKNEQKQEWVEAYRKTNSTQQAERVSGLAVYPDNSKIRTKIEYLKANHLNFFNNGK